jgi:hypothetical protein
MRRFPACIAAVLLFCGSARAAFIYKAYEGGTSGTLEFQMTTNVPIPAPIPLSNQVLLSDPPINGTVQIFAGSNLVPFPFSLQTANSQGSTPAFIELGPPMNEVFLQFASALTVPTTPGTYDLVPGQILNSVGPPFSFTGSVLLAGVPQVLSAIHPLDTLTIESTAVPEPGTLALLAIGIMGMAVYVWRDSAGTRTFPRRFASINRA